jgi:phytoene synthase
MKSSHTLIQQAVPIGSTFYYATLFCTAQNTKQGLWALFALQQLLSSIPYRSNEPNVVTSQFAWWNDEINLWFQGKPRHPITQVLKASVPQALFSQADVVGFIEALSQRSQNPSFESLAQLKAFHQQTKGQFQQLASKIITEENNSTQQFAQHLGVALGLVNNIIYLGHDLTHGQLYLPEQTLATFEVAIEDLQLGQPPSLNLIRLLQYLSQCAKQEYTQALNCLTDIEHTVPLFQLIQAKIEFALLHEIEIGHFKVLSQTTDLTPLRKLWLAWSVKRNARKYYKTC